MISVSFGTAIPSRDCRLGMTKYRFVTAHRRGKWYATLDLAQRFAAAIGAGFLDRRSGRFIAYPGTELESATFPD